MARKKKFPWGDDPRKGPMIGPPRPRPEDIPREPTAEEREFTRQLITSLSERIIAETDPEADAVDAIYAILDRLSAVSAARVLRQVEILVAQRKGT